MSKITDFARREPVVISDLVKYGMLLLTVFAVDITDAQQVAILAFVGVVLTAISRASVTPTVKLTDGQ
jgi:hypothetical protein